MRLRTTAAAGVLFAAALSIGTGTASAADLDCKDFATQAEAQAAFNADPSDPNRLDQDNDGIACETRPGGGTTTEDDTALASSQVSTRPVGGVAAGDGSSTDDGSALPYVLGGLALAGAGGAAVAARRNARGTA
jgi:hypothetical protein